MSETDPFVLLQGVISDLRSDFRALSDRLLPISQRLSKVEAKNNLIVTIILLFLSSFIGFAFYLLRSGFSTN